jgi:hypothetical protein
MTTLNIVETFKARCRAINAGVRLGIEPPIMPKTFKEYQLLQRKGEEARLVSCGLALEEARALSKRLKPKWLDRDSDGEPMTFGLEIHLIDKTGRSRYVEFINPTAGDFQWVG